MNKLYPLLLEHHLPVLVRYCIAVTITLVCSVMETGLPKLTGDPGEGSQLQSSHHGLVLQTLQRFFKV